jgi:branched-chain amino acid aminotransferase
MMSIAATKKNRMSYLPFPEAVVYVDGEFVPANEARVSVFDHGLLYGDGIFETMVVRTRRVFRLRLHVERLARSARSVRMEKFPSVETFYEIIEQLVRVNDLDEGFLRLIVTRGTGYPVLDPSVCDSPTVIAFVHPSRKEGLAGRNPLLLKTTATRKVAPDAIDPGVKCLNYMNSVLARIEATQAGADEALLLGHHGFVAEGPGGNIFIVRDGELETPPPGELLRGITRSAVIELANEKGIKVTERPLTLHDIYGADEIFLTSTFGGILPVAEVDGRATKVVAPGEMTKVLLSGYLAKVDSESEDPAEYTGRAG